MGIFAVMMRRPRFTSLTTRGLENQTPIHHNQKHKDSLQLQQKLRERRETHRDIITIVVSLSPSTHAPTHLPTLITYIFCNIIYIIRFLTIFSAAAQNPSVSVLFPNYSIFSSPQLWD